MVDLGCGSGVLAERLTRAGYDVLGIDISESMLKLARKRAPKARFVRGSLFQAKLPECVAVTAIGECLNYLFDGRSGTGLAAFFRRVHSALSPGGVFVFDVAEPGLVSKPVLLHFEGKGWAILVDKEEDRRRHLLIRRMTIFRLKINRRAGQRYRRSKEVHRQRLYPPKQVRSELLAAGYNSNAARLPLYLRRGGDEWKTLIPRETQTYLQIYKTFEGLVPLKSHTVVAAQSGN